MKSWARPRRPGPDPVLFPAGAFRIGIHARLNQGARGPRRDGLSGPYLLQAFDDHRLAGRKPARHCGDRGCRLSEPDAPLLGLVIGAEDIDIFALLIRQHRRAWDRHDLDRLHALQQHGHEFIVGELAYRSVCRQFFQDRIGNGSPQRDGVGVLRDGIVDEIQLTDLVIEPAVRQAQPDDDRLEAATGCIMVAQLASLAHGDRKVTYIGSWLTMLASVPELGVTTLPSVTVVRPILPSIGEWI